jgi:hypothetical protein
MTVRDRINVDVDSAVAADDPVGRLCDAVVMDLEHGADREELLATLDAHRRDYKAAGRDREQDAVTEIMERLVGWCAPAARI